MIRFFYIFFISLLFSCHDKRLDRDGAKKIFKDISPVYVLYSELKMRNIDSAKNLNDFLIDKFELMYKYDSTYINTAAYLGDLYAFGGNHSNAIYWYKKQLGMVSEVYKPCYSCIGLEYLRMGEIDSCKKYILEEIYYDETRPLIQRNYLVELKFLADSIYYQKDLELINSLNLKEISACEYSNQLLEFLLPFKDQNKEYFSIPFNQDTITSRIKNCRW